MAQKRQAGNPVSVRLTVQDRAALNDLINRWGLKQYVGGGRVFAWLIRQPEIIQMAALGLLPQESDQAQLMRAFVFPEIEEAASRALEQIFETDRSLYRSGEDVAQEGAAAERRAARQGRRSRKKGA